MNSILRRLRRPPRFVVAAGMLIRVVSIFVIPANRRPTAAMAWLLIIFSLPIPGWLLFTVLGSTKLSKSRQGRQREMSDLIAKQSRADQPPTAASTWPVWFSSLVTLNRRLGAMPMSGGNRAEFLTEFDASILSMSRAVDEAVAYVNIEFYIMSLDRGTKPFFDAVERAIERGVEVRVLFDSFATAHSSRYKETLDWLKVRGIPFHATLSYNPLQRQASRPDLRNHRKVVTVDGFIGFMGSMNLVQPDYNKKSNIRRGLEWKDLLVRLEGPVVATLDAVFVTDWFSETDDLLDLVGPLRTSSRRESVAGFDCQLVPSGPGFEGENNLRLFNSLVYAAEHRLVITSPYFVPDDSMLYAITTAAQRGVAVELFACHVADQFMVFHAQRSYYETLLRSGVRIYLYRDPVVLHSKHFTVDDHTAVVGSSNMDVRSFSLDLEVSLLFRDTDVVNRIREVEDRNRDSSVELTLDDWLDRPVLAKLLDNLCRLTAAVE